MFLLGNIFLKLLFFLLFFFVKCLFDVLELYLFFLFINDDDFFLLKFLFLIFLSLKEFCIVIFVIFKCYGIVMRGEIFVIFGLKFMIVFFGNLFILL